MNYTTNYQLNKPERNEQFNIDHWNNNSDAIDARMHTNQVNIATNASNIVTLLTNLTTNKATDTDSIYFKLMKLIYPVGSIYWSGNSTNPSSLFGGTWVQIKDKFIWAKGDGDTLGATGGAKTVTLTVENLPSHNHTFTPSGTITMNPHLHGLNNHTHSFSGTTGHMSANSSGTIYPIATYRSGLETMSGNFSTSVNKFTNGDFGGGSGHGGKYYEINLNVAHFHSFSGTTGGNSGTTTYTTSTGSFSGIQGTTSSNGSGSAFNILPPYVVKYCWERTA